MDRLDGAHINPCAPNMMAVCVDRQESGGAISGRLYHCFSAEPVLFCDANELLLCMEKVFDLIRYPQASTTARTFRGGESGGETVGEAPVKLVSSEHIQEMNGSLATLIVHVQYRQNATWQGRVLWKERDLLREFRSEIEFLKLLGGALKPRE